MSADDAADNAAPAPSVQPPPSSRTSAHLSAGLNVYAAPFMSAAVPNGAGGGDSAGNGGSGGDSDGGEGGNGGAHSSGQGPIIIRGSQRGRRRGGAREEVGGGRGGHAASSGSRPLQPFVGPNPTPSLPSTSSTSSASMSASPYAVMSSYLPADSMTAAPPGNSLPEISLHKTKSHEGK